MPHTTRELANGADALRREFLGESAELFLTKAGANLGAAIADGWHLETLDYRAIGGKKVYKLYVYDVDADRAQRLAVMDGAKISGRPYKVGDKDSPIGAYLEITREWIIELQPTGASPAPTP
jgi:hypothetical protein